MIKKIFNIQKVKYFVILFIVMSAFLTIFAYLTDIDNAGNEFTIAKQTVEIVEEFDPPEKLIPGISFTKKVNVKNTGTIPCYVRVFAQINDSTIGDYVDIDYDMINWTIKDDGYYYYNKILNSNELTSPLFTTVSISNDIEQDALNDFDIIVYTESVQEEGYSNIDDAFRLDRKENRNE